MPEGYPPISPQDIGRRMDIGVFSPSLSSHNLNGFPEPHQDLTHVMEPEGHFAYANHTIGQNYLYDPVTGAAQFVTPNTVDASFAQWPVADNQAYYTPESFPYAPTTHVHPSTFFANSTPVEGIYKSPTVPQPPMNTAQMDLPVRPENPRHCSSFTNQQQSRRTSANDVGFGAFVPSPISVVSSQITQMSGFEQQQHQEQQQKSVAFKHERKETTLTPLATQSLGDDDEVLSPDDAAQAKVMEEEQGKIARSHALYQAKPDVAGIYHCPHEGNPACNHKPTTLKCNYDKYVDSHLKPFRCKMNGCSGVQFSSTACLLRHEREAHGMHGHGSKPNLCLFPECERSHEGEGFPRRYNLYDHMRRVHDYDRREEASPPATPEQPSSARKTTTRKRKSKTDGVAKRQRATRSSQQQQREEHRNRLQKAFMVQKQELINALTQVGGPSDLADNSQLAKDIHRLEEISAEYRKLVNG
ncbi:hypothetical protein BDV95DRAFT_610523 [Massariosphaeria phaeospora]|uniref:C2H2-type domain-containing protein n=1 Tax=Massariosphaeria phaeospora TaxID=100035 RepID=A0A7C8I9B6_9PLEO|nr:hypothetical protein BDV95DRAFT_610523 [Massariosphaeria phaeospora]